MVVTRSFTEAEKKREKGMKQIFRIFAIAAVALSAAACQNDINDTIAPEGEGVSIRVTIADQTRVALGDFEEGKGYKLTFEEGDQLYIVNGWADSTEEGYYFDYTKQEDGTYTFTCTTEGVSSIVGDWKGVYYLGGRKNAIGAYGDTASESLNGVFMKGSGSIGSSTPIQLSVAPVLKLKSDYAVTISASNWIFCNGTKSYTTKTMGEWIYLAVNTAGTFEISASVLGEVVKSKTFELKENTIYNLGEIKPVEKEKDNANITIDGVFTDWDDVKTNVATTTGTQLHTLKAYADEDNIYIYAEFDPDGIKYLDMYFDMDIADATGNAYAWQWSNKANIRTEGKIYDWPDGVQTPYTYLWPSKKVFNEATAAWETDSTLSITAAAPASIGANIAAVELSLARTEGVNAMITGNTMGVGIFLMKGDWSSPGYLPANGTMLNFAVPAAK